MTDERLREIEERAANVPTDLRKFGKQVVRGGYIVAQTHDRDDFNGAALVDFAVSAVEDVPDLVTEVRRLRAELDAAGERAAVAALVHIGCWSEREARGIVEAAKVNADDRPSVQGVRAILSAVSGK